jgi:zinc-finger of transposase IS204/IS1001/IS1096/IS1165
MAHQQRRKCHAKLAHEPSARRAGYARLQTARCSFPATCHSPEPTALGGTARHDGATPRSRRAQAPAYLCADGRPPRARPEGQRHAGGYDGGAGWRRWRALDLGTVRAVLEADAPRVRCPVHGEVVAAVPLGAARRRAHPGSSMIRSPGWRRPAHGRRSASGCGSPGAAWARSSGESRLTWTRSPTGSPGCAGSGSMRSPIRKGTST